MIKRDIDFSVPLNYLKREKVMRIKIGFIVLVLISGLQMRRLPLSNFLTFNDLTVPRPVRP